MILRMCECSHIVLLIWGLNQGFIYDKQTCRLHMGVSKNNGTPKSSIFMGFSIINHPFWDTPIFGNIFTQIIQNLS